MREHRLGSGRPRPPDRCLPVCAPADEGLWDILIKDIPKEVTSYTFSMDILKPGVSYDFRVIAVNDYGFGTPSSPSQSVPGTTRGVRGGGSGVRTRGEAAAPEALGWGSRRHRPLSSPKSRALGRGPGQPSTLEGAGGQRS